MISGVPTTIYDPLHTSTMQDKSRQVLHTHQGLIPEILKIMKIHDFSTKNENSQNSFLNTQDHSEYA